MQNNNRFILWMLLGLVGFLIYSQWVQESNKLKQGSQVESSQSESDNKEWAGNVPSTVNDSEISVPSTGIAAPSVNTDSVINIQTDVYNIKISLKGGDIFEVGLPTYPISAEEPESQFKLFAADEIRHLVSQTGLISAKNQPTAPNHTNTTFVTEKSEYRLEDGADKLTVTLSYEDKENQLVFLKRYIFERGKFQIGFEQEVINNSDSEWIGQEYRQLIEIENPSKKRGFGASSYTGAVFSLPNDNYKYEKIPFKKMSENNLRQFEGSDGWIAFIEQYFVVAWTGTLKEAPAASDEVQLNLPKPINVIEALKFPNEKRYLIRIKDKGLVTVEPHTSHIFKSRLFAGPKDKEQLMAAAEKLDLTLDYGWFSPISNIMLWLLKFYHSYIGNWGWSIILLTCTVKFAMLYFANKGYVSMARMKHVGPQLLLIREQYGDDRQKVSEEMMKLYRKEKINPLGGCWPILIQIPIFIALFWMLQESVELRQAPWIFWIDDLSKMDPYFVLPLIMGVTMFFQQRLNPTPPDPMQAKLMKWMPVMFTFMFMWFASGIVLYWIVNNLLTILQQSVITRRIEQGSEKAKA